MADNLPSGIMRGEDGKLRCSFANNELYQLYHDNEWGVPQDNDIHLFENICLEGFQAGLSWSTVLKKRENFRSAFDGFDFNIVSKYTDKDVNRLLANPGIVRHRRKIESTINNAKRAVELKEEYGSLAGFVWEFEPAKESRPTKFDKNTLYKITKTAESAAMSKELKKRGWSFIGPTTMHAFMQSMGLVNDHIEECEFRCRCEQLRRQFVVPKKRLGR